MKTVDERKTEKARTFRELQIGDVFEKVMAGSLVDSSIWIKTNYSSSECEDSNAFRLSDNLNYIENRFGYFNPDTVVRKLDAKLVILGEAE